MTEQEYLSRLEKALKGATEEERNEAMAFYRAYFEEGGTPSDTPEEAAARLLHEEKAGAGATATKKYSAFGWKLAVLILTSPIWIGIVAVWFSILVTAVLLLAVFPLSLAAAALTFLVSGLFYFSGYVPMGLLGLGAALTVAGLAMLLWKPCQMGIVGIWKSHVFLIRKFWHWLRKESTYEIA
jgi:uncharacterized membrane protein